MEPFAASGRYYAFGELDRPRSRDLRTYGTGGTTIARNSDGTYQVTDGSASFALSPTPLDFNRLSLRSNLVLRWEWARGSTLFLIWQQNRAAAATVGDLVRIGRGGPAFASASSASCRSSMRAGRADLASPPSFARALLARSRCSMGSAFS